MGTASREWLLGEADWVMIFFYEEERPKERGTDLIVSCHNSNQRRYEDGRKLRRYNRRWKIERTNAWL